MKILIDARMYGLENAGLGRYAMNLIENLSKIDSKNNYIILLRKIYFDSLQFPKNWKKVLADFGHYTFSEQIKLPLIINKERPDLSHFLHFNIPLFRAGKYVVTIHDLLMHKNKGLAATTLSAPIYFSKRLAYQLAFKNAVIKARHIIVPSQTVKEELVDYYHLESEKISVIYEGVDERINSKISLNIDKPYFVYTGNAYPHKNLERLVEAIIFLNKNLGKKAYLAIASARNVFTERLQKLINKMNASEFVKTLGFVPDEEIGGLYKNSVAFVFPSMSEGFGLPGLEAIKMGTLVIASDIPVFKEIYKDNAMYFNPLDFTSMAKRMEDALNMNEEQRKELIEKGGLYVKRYSWEKMAKETIKTYENFK